jgi:hypothetical protein
VRVTISLAALIAVLTAVSAVHLSDKRDANKSRPQTGAPSPVHINWSTMQSAPSVNETASTAQERNRQLATAIERALVSREPHHRETAFNFVLPELLREEPDRVIAIVARQEPGEQRDALRDEVARHWITQNPDAAIEWMNSLEQADRTASATIATRTLAAINPAHAIAVADEFGIGRDDGSLEHMVQIWATEQPDEAMRWIEGQPPDDPRTAQLRARIRASLPLAGATTRSSP